MPSTVISSFHYNPETKLLTIVFVTGMVYGYKNVPLDVYEEFKSAFSKGTFFNRFIKPKYSFQKLNE